MQNSDFKQRNVMNLFHLFSEQFRKSCRVLPVHSCLTREVWASPREINGYYVQELDQHWIWC